MIDFNELKKVQNRQELLNLLEMHSNEPIYREVLEKVRYEEELRLLQAQLVDFQKWAAENKRKIAIIFEGRDASGKGGTIKRFMEHLNPRQMRLVALNKPTDVERGQWYFSRYIKELPNEG